MAGSQLIEFDGKAPLTLEMPRDAVDAAAAKEIIYSHPYTKTYMSQCSCHSWNTSMLFVSSGSAHVTRAWLPILRLIL